MIDQARLAVVLLPDKKQQRPTSSVRRSELRAIRLQEVTGLQECRFGFLGIRLELWLRIKTDKLSPPSAAGLAHRTDLHAKFRPGAHALNHIGKVLDQRCWHRHPRKGMVASLLP